MTRIRPYRADDSAACHAVYVRAVREGAAPFYTLDQRMAWAPNTVRPAGMPDKLLDQWAWVAEDDRQITGFMSLRPDGYLDMAFVMPEVMGRGTAAALYDTLIARARAESLPRLTVHASHLARRFLDRRGWQVDAAEQHPVGGQTLERFAMSLCHVAGP